MFTLANRSEDSLVTRQLQEYIYQSKSQGEMLAAWGLDAH